VKMFKKTIKTNIIYTGDCLNILKTLPNDSVQCCITSPPYYNLRDYETAEWDGGSLTCDHSIFLGGHGENSKKQITSSDTQKYQYKDICKRCGAKRIDKQIGVEKTVEEYIEKLVVVFCEIRRILKPNGTLWLNIGDSYTNSTTKTDKCKIKDLLGIPWTLAFAMRDDGWYLRQDIIWAKGNPMPESVLDRCTKSHEYIFLMTKSGKYYFDSKAIREPNQDTYNGKRGTTLTRKKMQSAMRDFSDKEKMKKYSTEGRNKRDVWHINAKPFLGAHFATFPPKLVEICILAGCPENGIVLDPFGGSGTTGAVANSLNRKYIMIELNSKYVKLAEERIKGR